MASYEDKQTKKYMEYHNTIYVGIGCSLGTLCHALFTFRWGTAHYTMLLSGILAIIYALVQMYRRNSYAPYRDKKIDGFDILGIFVTIKVLKSFLPTPNSYFKTMYGMETEIGKEY